MIIILSFWISLKITNILKFLEFISSIFYFSIGIVLPFFAYYNHKKNVWKSKKKVIFVIYITMNVLLMLLCV